jgi:hypothetical protein
MKRDEWRILLIAVVFLLLALVTGGRPAFS